MPYYDHNKDYPFAAFITNLGKYNEGELVGEWVKFPTTAEELKEVFKRIGIGQKDDFGQPYEEWFITDYDCYVDGLYSKLGEYENLDELNYLASKLDEMSESEYAQFQAGMEMGDHCGSLQEIINLTENLDCYEVYPDIHDYDDLGRYYIEELDVMEQKGWIAVFYLPPVTMWKRLSLLISPAVRCSNIKFCWHLPVHLALRELHCSYLQSVKIRL